jgi:hypothetical protein
VVSGLTVGTLIGSQAGTICSDAVSLQLAQMAAVFNTLTRQFDDTCTDFACLMAELMLFKVQVVSLSSSSGDDPSVYPEAAAPVQDGDRAPEVNCDFIASIASVRRDLTVAMQANSWFLTWTQMGQEIVFLLIPI